MVNCWPFPCLRLVPRPTIRPYFDVNFVGEAQTDVLVHMGGHKRGVYIRPGAIENVLMF